MVTRTTSRSRVAVTTSRSWSAKNQPSISTTQLPASGAIGVTYKDKATLSGGVNYAEPGSINFKLYAAADCGGSVLDNETVTGISANGDYTTPNGFAIQNAGTYYWVASFSGDANNKSFTSACNDEPVVVAKNQPSISTTQLPASGAIGITLQGQGDAVRWRELRRHRVDQLQAVLGSRLRRLGARQRERSRAISANGDYTTPDGFAIQNAGTYYWVASFSGDANNKSFTSACNDEPVVVAKNQPSIVTTQQPASGAIGITYKDKATLSGGANYTGTGSINFKLYSAADCGGSVLDDETGDSVSANGDYTTPNGFADQQRRAPTTGLRRSTVTRTTSRSRVRVTTSRSWSARTAVDRDDAAACVGRRRRYVQGQGDAVGWRELRRAPARSTSSSTRAADCGGSVLDNETVTSIARTATTRRRTASRSTARARTTGLRSSAATRTTSRSRVPVTTSRLWSIRRLSTS